MWFRENFLVLLHVLLLKEKETDEKRDQNGDDRGGTVLEKNEKRRSQM